MRKLFVWIPAFAGMTILLLVFPLGVFAQAATLSLDPSTGTFNRGCSFSVNVNIDTGGSQTDGADAILIYDPSRVTANSITNGTVYPDYPGNNIDAQSGKISILSLASVTAGFSGKGVLATINFTVKDSAATGVTQVKFDFDPLNKAKTTDSNVVERSTVVDILNSVVDGNYTVGAGSCGVGQPTPTPASTQRPRTGGTGDSGTPSSTYIPPKTLPEGGTPQFTATLAIMGGVLTILGIFGLALL